MSCLVSVQASLIKACPGCGGMVHIRKVSCSCGHVFVAKHNKHLLTPSRKHTLHSFRAIETVEKAADQLTKLVKPRKEHKKPKRKHWNASPVTELVTIDFKVAFKEILHQGTK